MQKENLVKCNLFEIHFCCNDKGEGGRIPANAVFSAEVGDTNQAGIKKVRCLN